MKIDKRRPITFDVNGIKNNSKYFNMMNWKGIIENHNIYTIDQNSFEDCKNIYVDDDERLVSRDPLIENILSEEILPLGYNLIDIVNVGEDKIYISQDTKTNEYRIIIINNITYTDNKNIIVDITNYNLCTIEHYAICFNDSDEGAKVYDTLNKVEGWQPLSNFIEVPVIKRVVGSVVTDLSSNRNYLDRNHYKEEYLWTDELQTDLPSGTSSVKVTSEGGTNLELTLTNSNILPEYRTYRKLNIKGPNDSIYGIEAGKISKVNDIIAVAFKNYVQISYTNGEIFERVYYPSSDIIVDNDMSPINPRGSYIATLSDDGKFFFYVGESAVYRYSLADKTWSAIYIDDDSTIPIKQGNDARYWDCGENYHFLNGETFTFMYSIRTLYSSAPITTLVFGMGSSLRLYKNDGNITQVTEGRLGSQSFLEMGLYNSGLQPGMEFDKGSRRKIRISYNKQYNNAIITAIAYHCSPVDGTYYPSVDQGELVILSEARYIRKALTTIDPSIVLMHTSIKDVQVNIENISGTPVRPSISIKINIIGWYYNTSGEYYIANKPWVNLAIEAGNKISDGSEIYAFRMSNINFIQTRSCVGRLGLIEINTNTYAALNCEDTLLTGTVLFKDVEENKYVTNPTELDGAVDFDTDLNVCLDMKVMNNTIILTRVIDDNCEIYVNDLASGDLATFTFEYGASEPFVEVPDISYSDTELYLAFDKTLRITNNKRDEDDLYFNLPSVNDQSFIDKITALKNISTTEVAVFFEDNIYICSKVYDETLSRFRYDYYRTKLSTGVRLGDSVINTLEGSFTVFPTRRGLAALNYQAFMATTDQVITYVSDNISNYWTEFYDNSQRTNHPIHIMQWRTILIVTNGSYEMILFDLEKASWWKWEVPVNIRKCLTDQITLRVISNKLYEFKASDLYYDLPNTPNEQMIEWNMISQQLHMNAPDNYKNLRQLVFQLYDNNSNTENIYTILATIKLYRKKAEVRLPETIKFKIDELRTFVKRFNYWKVNEIQWALSSDAETHTPIKLQLNGISVKYEIGEEVR